MRNTMVKKITILLAAAVTFISFQGFANDTYESTEPGPASEEVTVDQSEQILDLQLLERQMQLQTLSEEEKICDAFPDCD